MVSVTSQQQTRTANVLVEEKTFPISLERSADLLKEAIEYAIGTKLEELAPGMWHARTEVQSLTRKEITVRALPVEGGTTVEIRIEHRPTPGGIALSLGALIVGGTLLLPLLYLIPKLIEEGREESRERLVLMHKSWNEVTSAVDAPRRADYRASPERARMRVADETPPVVEEELEGSDEGRQHERPLSAVE